MLKIFAAASLKSGTIYAAGFTLAAMVVAAGCASAPFRPLLPQEKEEYAIYRFLVDSVYLRGKTWTPELCDYTLAGSPFDFPDSLSRRPDSVKHIPVSMIAYAAKHKDFNWNDLEHDYGLKNAKPWRLQEEAFRLTRSPDLRREFSAGTYSVRFSRVAFSPKFDQAIVYMEYALGKIRDNGSYVVFRRENGLWRLVDRFGAWES